MFGKSKPPVKSPDLNAIKDRAQILIIDDQAWAYEDNLDREGYHVNRIPAADVLDDLVGEKYTLILLDVQGVGATLGAGANGLDILQYIKSRNPLKPIILYSSKSVPMEGVKSAALADSIRKKSDNFTLFKSDIDALLLDSASAGRYFAAINRRLGDRAIDVPELPKRYLRAMQNGNIRSLEQYLEEHDFEREIIRDVVSIVALALAVLA